MEAVPRLTSDGKPMSPQARTLAWIDHPILMIYVLTATSPDLAEDSNFERVESELRRIAVAVAFPKMSQDEIVVAARDSKTYRVNQVFWRAYNGFVEDEGDDVADGEGA